jgi:hypothetical protein
MTREAKISLLNGIKSGVIPMEYLDEPKIFIFIQKLNKPGYYEMSGKDYSEEALNTFRNKIENKNRLLKSLGSKTDEDKVITVVFMKGKTIL